MRSKKNREPISVTIDNLSHEGRGVGRVNGKTTFVQGALPGEVALARKTKGRRNYDEALAISIENPHADRIEPKCEHYEICGGCSLQHLRSDAQIAHKQAVLLELLAHHADAKPAHIIPALTGPIWHYRRKARLGVKYVEKKGGALVGFREKSSPYIADIEQCEVLDTQIGHRLIELRELVNKLSIRERIPQFEVAIGDEAAAIVVRHLDDFNTDDLERLATYQEISGVAIYLQPEGESSVHALNQATPSLWYRVSDIRFKFSPTDFVQINHEINEAMVARVLDYLALESTDHVLDLFCGLGNISLPIAKRAGSVLGIEGSAVLVEKARSNAVDNGIPNADFLTHDLSNIDELKKIDFNRFNKLLLDPPRSGAEEICSQIDLSGVERLVYVSCNPVTLARDANHLINEQGFTLTDAGVMDMFPHTAHVESLAVFVR